jgi:hypothetical protein
MVKDELSSMMVQFMMGSGSSDRRMARESFHM